MRADRAIIVTARESLGTQDRTEGKRGSSRSKQEEIIGKKERGQQNRRRASSAIQKTASESDHSREIKSEVHLCEQTRAGNNTNGASAGMQASS